MYPRQNIPDYETKVLLTKSPKFRIEWYYTVEGRMPAREYFEAEVRPGTQGKMIAITKHFVNIFPKFLHEKYFKIVDPANKIYELKPDYERFFCFFTEDARLVVTNAFQKDSYRMSKKDRRDMAISATHKNDYIQRTKAGNYYA